MDLQQLILDMRNKGVEAAFKGQNIPVEQTWPPAWLEYEQPGASTYEFDAPINLQGVYDSQFNPNNLYANRNTTLRNLTQQSIDRTFRHEGEHRQHKMAKERDRSPWSRWDRTTPQDLQSIIQKHNTFAGKDLNTLAEAMSVLSEMQHGMKGTQQGQALTRDLEGNKNWMDNYRYDYNPLFNIRDPKWNR